MKILIVDDDVELSKAVVSSVSSFGHDVQFTNDPREGLKLIREQDQDMVILDLSMPENSGIDRSKSTISWSCSLISFRPSLGSFVN